MCKDSAKKNSGLDGDSSGDRLVLSDSEAGRSASSSDVEEEEEVLVYDEFSAPPALFYGLTAAFLISSYTLALSVTSLGLVLAVVGATGRFVIGDLSRQYLLN